MRWQAPVFVELEMNAEIGAYQADPEDDRGSDFTDAPRAAPQTFTAPDLDPAR